MSVFFPLCINVRFDDNATKNRAIIQYQLVLFRNQSIIGGFGGSTGVRCVFK